MRTVSPRSGPPPIPVSPRLTKKLIHPDHDERLFPVLFSPDGRSILANCTISGRVQIWNANTGEQIRTLQLPKRSSSNGTFTSGGPGTLSPDGRIVYVPFAKYRFLPLRKDGKIGYHCETEGEILMWDVATGRQLPSLKQSPPHSVIGATVSPDGATLLALDFVGDDAVRGYRKYGLTRWNTRTGEHHHLLDGFWNLVFAPDSKTFAASLTDVQAISPTSVKSRGKLILCDAVSGKERLVFAQTDNGSVTGTAFSPDGRYLAGFQDDVWATKPPPSEVKLWDAATGKEVGAIAAPEGTTLFRRPGQVMGAFASAVFSPDGRWLATCLHTGRIYLYDIAGRKLAWSQDVKNGYLRGATFSPDGRWLAVVGQDTPEDLKPREEVSPFDLPQPRIFLFDMKAGGQPEEIVAPHGQMVWFAFSPDGKTIAVSGTGCVWLFDVRRPITHK
ncbi:MAG: WD40 repeat domain-containing protein [Gemmataceae bacterium]